MKIKKYITVTLAFMVVASIVLAGCSKSSSTSSTTTEETTSPAETAVSDTETSPEAAFDPMAKYDPPIELRTVKDITTDSPLKDGDTYDDNVWTREYLDTLGIKLKNDWLVSDGKFAEKLNLTIASGDLPDMFYANNVQFTQLVDAGKIHDLTEIWDKYASEKLKRLYSGDGGIALKSGTVDGKLMSIPAMTGNLGPAKMVWVRKDWAAKLNTPDIKTFADVVATAEAFAKGDPDGNGKDDTYGLGMGMPVSPQAPGFSDMMGFFNSFHAVMMDWKADESGNLVWGSLQPEAKTALAKLAELYKAGLIDREFVSKSADQIAQDIVNNKIGIFYGSNWNPYYPLYDLHVKDGVDWQPYKIPSADGTPAKAQLAFSIATYQVVNKEFAHPEALVQMLNLYVEKTESDPATYLKYGTGADGTMYSRFAPVYALDPDDTRGVHLKTLKAIETGDCTTLLGTFQSRCEMIVDWTKTGNREYWNVSRQQGPDSSFSVIDQYFNEDLLIPPAYIGGATPAVIANQGALTKLENETFAKIITGAVGIDEFDKFVETWKKLGGDQMTKEVNEKAARMK